MKAEQFGFLEGDLSSLDGGNITDIVDTMISSKSFTTLLKYKNKLNINDNEVLKKIFDNASLSEVQNTLRKDGLAIFVGLNQENATKLLETVPELVIALSGDARNQVFGPDAIEALPSPEIILEKFLKKVFPTPLPWQLDILITSSENLSPLSLEDILSSYLLVFKNKAAELEEDFRDRDRNSHGELVIKLLQAVVTKEERVNNSLSNNRLSNDLAALLSLAKEVLERHAPVKFHTRDASTIFALLDENSS